MGVIADVKSEQKSQRTELSIRSHPISDQTYRVLRGCTSNSDELQIPIEFRIFVRPMHISLLVRIAKLVVPDESRTKD